MFMFLVFIHLLSLHNHHQCRIIIKLFFSTLSLLQNGMEIFTKKSLLLLLLLLCDLKARKERQIVAAMQCIVIDVGIENSLSSTLLPPPPHRHQTDHLLRLKQTTKQKERKMKKIVYAFLHVVTSSSLTFSSQQTFYCVFLLYQKPVE